MPELPEVETFRRQIETAVQNKTVTDVDVRPDSIVFCGKSPAIVKKVFLGMKIKKCLRQGTESKTLARIPFRNERILYSF